ncbi:NUDIX domain-containing protein [Microbacterium sp. MEC084]|jgi:8-oxo-dGTP pyrophosphatase MutT (NUDIX family)|uniref:NUDIX hydrolase n=1 Tax=unclassified Microbacterium TaxID=2609290 RepID=UPI0006F495A1|nr:MULTISPECIES: NUDIX hydrolase [unclassified Microbacterium]KQZ07300.1 DNA mismatch repair protein MutT [Microbacterium sp. Root53]MCD1269342.1 NUDIX domain-containing protein [Microbacterium sp. MEC084]
MDMRVAAYCVIVDDEDRVLLSRWIEGRVPAWSMPGGGLEPGEDPADAARREVWEETGYEVRLDALLGIDSHVIPAKKRLNREASGPLHALRIVYRATVVGGTLTHEVDGSSDMAEWVPLSKVRGIERVSLVDKALDMAGIHH